MKTLLSLKSYTSLCKSLCKEHFKKCIEIFQAEIQLFSESPPFHPHPHPRKSYYNFMDPSQAQEQLNIEYISMGFLLAKVHYGQPFFSY